jgi:hypothetical protein
LINNIRWRLPPVNMRTQNSVFDSAFTLNRHPSFLAYVQISNFQSGRERAVDAARLIF